MACDHRYRLETTHRYDDEAGRPLWRKVKKRCEECGRKTFSAKRHVGGGVYVSGRGDSANVLYRLPELRAGIRAERRVWVVEGERDADRLVELGEVATTTPDGAGSWDDSYGPSLSGADLVLVVADADEPGRRHAQQVAHDLVAYARRVVVVEPAAGKDISDHLDAGLGLDELTGAATVLHVGIASGLGAAFRSALPRPDDPTYRGEVLALPESWAPLPDASPVEFAMAEPGEHLDPFEVPMACGTCGAFLMVQLKPDQPRMCQRCDTTYPCESEAA